MKRLFLILAVVSVLAGAGIYLQRRAMPRARQVAAWLPGSTILFADLPDLRRTGERWPETALAQTLDEPEVQAFLARPLSEIPHRAELDDWLAQLRRIDPLHFFFAITDWNGAAPSAVAGLCYAGSREDLDVLVDRLRNQAAQSWPVGKPDIQKYGSGEIETFTTPTFSAALAYRGRWFFIATDVSVLKATLDRFEGQKDPGSLAELPAFTKCLQHLPGAADSVFFVQPALLADKVTTLALMLNPTAPDSGGADALKQVQAVGAALKLDGEVMRDGVFVMTTQPGDETPLARDSLKLSSPNTIVAVANRMREPGQAQLPDPKSDPTGMLQLLDSYLKAFSDQGLGGKELARAFGPESGFVLDWPAGTMAPSPLAMLDVREPALARKFLDTLMTLPGTSGVEVTRREEGGMALYSLPASGIGILPLQVSLGLTGKCVIAALSVDALKQAAKRWDTPATSGLAGTEAYRKAEHLVPEPTLSFTYLDTKAIFDRVYGLFKGVASMGFVPHLADYVDIGKLPASNTIVRHLSPIVASGSAKDGGILMESAGPVTMTQAGAGAAVLLGAAAVPLIEQQLKGQSVSIPGFPWAKKAGAP